MSKPSYLNANVSIATDSFGGWINKTNQIVYDMATTVVTVGGVSQPNTTNGATTTGNGHVQGILSANTLVATNALRGGTVSAPANLTISSNAIFQSNITVNSTANSVTINANNAVFTSNVAIAANTKTVTIDAANTTINGGDFFVRTGSTFTGRVDVDGSILDVTANTVFTSATLLANVDTLTIGTNGTDLLVSNSRADFNANVNIDGILTSTANATFSGATVNFNNATVNIGDATSDRLFVTAYLGSDLLPANTNIDLGSDANPYGNLHVTYVYSDNDVETLNEFILRGASTRTLKSQSTTTGYQPLNVTLRTSTGNTQTPIVFTNTSVNPGANTTFDLGTAALSWANTHTRDLLVSNNATVTNTLTVNTQANTASLMVRDLTTGRVPYVNTGGEIVDSANLTFSGTLLSVTGNETVSGTLTVNTQANTASLMVRDLTATRITYAGTGGELADSANLTFSGTALNVTGTITSSGLATFNGGITTDGGVFAVTDTTGNISTSGTLSVAGNVTASSNVNVTNAVTATNGIFTNLSDTTLTPARVVYSTTGGYLIDSANLTFSGTSLDIIGNESITGTLTVNTQANTASLMVRNLTVTHVPYVGVGGEIIDSPNLTFNGTTLSATGLSSSGVTSTSTLSVGSTSTFTGNVTASANVNVTNVVSATNGSFTNVIASSLTPARLVYVGANDNLVDSANLTFSGTLLTVTGNETVSGTLTVNTQANTASLMVRDLTEGRVTFAGANGELIDSSNLTFSGSALTVIGDQSISGTLSVSTQANTASLMVRDLTETRIPYVGVSGEIIDSANLTFSGTTLSTNNVTATSATFTNATVTSLTPTRLVYAGASDNLVDSANLTFSGTLLTVTGSETVSGTLTVNTQANTASLMVRDLTAGRITYAGTGGELVDNATLTFNGTTLSTNNVSISGTTTQAGIVTVTNTTNSTSNNTGAVVISGGLGVAKTGHIGENLIVNGDLTVFGTTSISGGSGFAANTGSFQTLTVTDTATINQFNSDLLPSANNTYNIGSTTRRWANINVANVVAGVVTATTTESDEFKTNELTVNTESATVASTSQTQIASFPAASFRTCKAVIQARDTSTGEVQSTELLIIHNGTTASSVEYGTIFTGASSIVSYEVDINLGNVRILATRSSVNSTQYRTVKTLMTA